MGKGWKKKQRGDFDPQLQDLRFDAVYFSGSLTGWNSARATGERGYLGTPTAIWVWLKNSVPATTHK